MIQEQLHSVEVGTALQQTTPGFTPQVVHVEIHLRQVLAAAGEKPAVRSPMRPVADRGKPKRRAHLLIVLQALADLVAEHVRVTLELLAIRIVPPELEHRPEFLRQRNVPFVNPTGRYTWAPAAWLAGPSTMRAHPCHLLPAPAGRNR